MPSVEVKPNETKYYSSHTGKQIDEGINSAEKAILINKSGQKTTDKFSLEVDKGMTFANQTNAQYSAPLTVDDYNQNKIWNSQNSIAVRKSRRLRTKRENTSDLVQESNILIDYTLADNLKPEDYSIVLEVCRRTHGQYDWQIPETTFGDTGTGGRDKRLGYIVIAGKTVINQGKISWDSNESVKDRIFLYAELPSWMGKGYIDPNVFVLDSHKGTKEIRNNFFLPLVKPVLPEKFEPNQKIEDGSSDTKYEYWLNFDQSQNNFGIMGVDKDKQPLLIRFSIRKVTTDINDTSKYIFGESLATSQIVAIGVPKKKKDWFAVTTSLNGLESGKIFNLYRSIK